MPGIAIDLRGSKESLLVSALDAMRDELRAAVELDGASAKPFDYARALVYNAFAHPDHHRMLVDRRTDFVVQRRFLELVKALVAKDLAPLLPDKLHLEAATHFVGGGLFELMTWGVNSYGRVTVDEVVVKFLLLVGPINHTWQSAGRPSRECQRGSGRSDDGPRPV